MSGIVSLIFQAYMDSLYKNDLTHQIKSTEEAMEILQEEGILLQRGNERTRERAILEEGDMEIPSLDDAVKKAEAFLGGG
jgi:hypothetical protein